MRLERMDVRDVEGRCWSVAGIVGRVTGWWSRAEGRAHRFASLCSALSSGDSEALRQWEGRKIDRLELDLSAREGRIRAFQQPGARTGWWKADSSDALPATPLSESLLQRESQSCVWRIDRADEIAAWFAQRTRERMDRGVVSEGELTDRRRYEEALEEAARLRGLLDAAMAERDRLRALWQVERDEEQQRIQDLRRQLAEIDASLGEADARRSRVLDEIQEVERREELMRRELRERPVSRPVPAPRPVSNVSTVSSADVEAIRRRLQRIDQRVLVWRKGQERIDVAIGKVRGELAAVAISEDLETTQSFERIRRELFGFESAAEEVLALRRKLDATGIAESERRLPSSERLKANCEHLYEELHRLHERLVRRQAALARREISSRLRRLRRLHRELAGHLAELLEDRAQLMAHAARLGITAARLAGEAETGCQHCGHTSETCHEVVTVRTEPERVVWLTDRRRDELIEGLREAAERLRLLRLQCDEIDAERGQIAQRRQEWERHLRTWELERLPSELALALDRQREEIERLEGLRRRLLEASANYERHRESRGAEGLERLSVWVDRVSGHHWRRVVLSRDERELELIDAQGHRHAWHALDATERSTVAVGLVLGWNADRAAESIWPTVIELGARLPLASSQACETVEASARIGAPIWIVAEEAETISQWVASQAICEIPTWKTVAPPMPAAPMPMRLLVTRSHNIDAEEFPGEFRDQVVLERVDDPAAIRGVPLDERWRAEDRIEAYATGSSLDRVEDPEAWLSQWLGDDDSAATKPVTRMAWSVLPLEGDTMMSASLVRWLAGQGITTWGALADADLQGLKKRQGLVAWNDRVEAWHATAKLLCRGGVPGVFDARVLAACEVTEPKELDRYPAFELLQRIRALGAHEEGRRLLAAGSDEELTRLCGWVSSLEHARSMREFGYRDATVAETSQESSSKATEAISREDRKERKGDPSSKERAARPSREKDAAGKRKTLRFDPAAQRVPMEGSERRRRLAGAARDERGERLRFHLELESDVELAPSIGPKGAEKLRRLGIESISDFLAADPEDLATELALSRVDGETLESWQRQTELVLRVPNLRGHDAQLLVACGVTTAEALQKAEARELWERISPMAQSSEGRRILRGAPAPTPSEIKSWIRWARHTRTVRVA